jgi:hypothetical protein
MLRHAQLEAAPESESYSYNGPSLTYELEHCLLFGKGSSGQLVIRHQELFAREWREWRKVILPKFIECFPARRPAAMYIAGELPMRPLQIEMPLAHPLRDERSLYVIGEDGDGFWYRDWPEPYQRAEPRWLREIDAIDDAELKAARGRTRAEGLKAYCWEHANVKKRKAK